MILRKTAQFVATIAIVRPVCGETQREAKRVWGETQPEAKRVRRVWGETRPEAKRVRSLLQ